MNGLARPEREVAAERAHAHLLLAATVQIHLYAAGILDPSRAMPECFEIELARQLPVDPSENVLVEARGHAARVVIGALERRAIFAQIGADQQAVDGTKMRTHHAQKRRRLFAAEVAEVRAQPENESRRIGTAGKIEMAQ